MTVNKAKLNKRVQKYKDEIVRLQKLVKKNKKDKRNEVRIKKVKVLKALKTLTNKFKSRKISDKKYSIQYKDLQREYYSYKITKKNIPKIDDLKLKYSGIWNWNANFSRGILTGMLRTGQFNDILGFDFNKRYVIDGLKTPREAYWSAIEILKQNEEAVYKKLEEYFNFKDYTWEEIATILEDEFYKRDLSVLWYQTEYGSRMDLSRFNTGLNKLFESIKTNQGLLEQ